MDKYLINIVYTFKIILPWAFSRVFNSVRQSYLFWYQNKKNKYEKLFVSDDFKLFMKYMIQIVLIYW